MDQPRCPFGQVLAEILPAEVRLPRPGEAHEVHEHGVALTAAAACARVVTGWQPHGHLAHVRITERVTLEHLRDMLQDDHGTGLPTGTFECHQISSRGYA